MLSITPYGHFEYDLFFLSHNFLAINKVMRKQSCTRCVKRTSRRPSRARKASRIKRRVCSHRAKSEKTDSETKKTAPAASTVTLSTTPSIVGSSIKKQLRVVCTDPEDKPWKALASLRIKATGEGANAVIGVGVVPIPSKGGCHYVACGTLCRTG